MAELEDQLQADIAGLEAEFAIQQQQILNEENAGAYIEEVSDESRELWKRFEADPLAVIYGTSASDSSSSQITPQLPTEKFIARLASRYAYNADKTVDQNLQIMESLATHPFAFQIRHFPCHADFKYARHTGSNTGFTDALYNSANEFEDAFDDHIHQSLETLLQIPCMQSHKPNLEKYCRIICQFLRVAPQKIDLDQLIRLTFPRNERTLKLCTVHGGSQPYHIEADNERRAVLSTFGPWDNVAYEGVPDTHRAFKKHAQSLYVYSDETEPDLSADTERDNRNATHCKRIFDIMNTGLSFCDENYSCPVIYPLVCNILTLPYITEFLKNTGQNVNIWIAKAKPTGHLAIVEKVEENIHGFLLKRSLSTHRLFVEFVIGSNPLQHPKSYKYRLLQEVTPEGWDPVSLQCFPGNTLDARAFSLLARRISHETIAFCRQENHFPDIKALACYHDLTNAALDPCIANPMYAICKILEANQDYPREKAKMLSRDRLTRLKYDPKSFASHFASALFNWQMQAKQAGDDEITDEVLMEKFRVSFVLQWKNKKGADPYDEKLIELADIWEKKTKNRKQPAADERMLAALSNFTTLRQWLNQTTREYDDSGIKRQEPPEYYWDTGYHMQKKNNLKAATNSARPKGYAPFGVQRLR